MISWTIFIKIVLNSFISWAYVLTPWLPFLVNVCEVVSCVSPVDSACDSVSELSEPLLDDWLWSVVFPDELLTSSFQFASSA